MRVKPEFAAVAILATFGVALAVGLMLGVVATKATAPAVKRIPACPCAPSMINT